MSTFVRNIRRIFQRNTPPPECLFFTMLRYSLGIGGEVPSHISREEWQEMYVTADRQAMLGIFFEGIRRMPQKPALPRILFLNWYAQAQYISGANRMATGTSRKWTGFFAAHGHRSCILKGQGNALMYPSPESRTPGDVDIYVEGDKEEIIQLLEREGIKGESCAHHFRVETDEKVETEIHFLATQGSMNKEKNARLQSWLTDELRYLRDAEGFCVPTARFNRIMQLSHMQHHFVVNGITLRQLTDYYFVLLQEEDVDMHEELKRFGLREFAEGVMYIMQTYFHLPDKYLLARPHKRRGEAIMSAVMDGGFFGRYANDATRQEGFLCRNIYHTVNILNNIMLFPTEYCEEGKKYLARFWQRIR